MTADFNKFHGLGNDYLVIDPNVTDVAPTERNVRLICDRHLGVGADGILYGPIDAEPPRVRIFNPDGSEAEKSGNGLRIFARYLFEKGYVNQREFEITTLGGLVCAEVLDDNARLIRVDMGSVSFAAGDVGAAGPARLMINEELQVGNSTYYVTCASIGNPHCVIPMNTVTEARACELGPLVENHPMFPNRINMQLLKVIDRSTIEIRIWERGAGYTLASGSSACAAAAAAHRLGLANRTVNVQMPGGTLLVEIADDDHVFLTGPVEAVFEGRFCTEFLDLLE